MIVYGTKVKSDIILPYDLSSDTQVRYEVTLSSNIPDQISSTISCGFPLYFAHGRKVYLYSNQTFNGSSKGQPWCYEVENIVKFYWIGEERAIYYELLKKGNPKLLGFWLIHLVLPLYFTLEGMYDFLHAGAVEVDGKPILFIAPSMGGKSTMTDYFINQGHTLISDDKVPTFISEGKYMAVGSHPYHRPYRKFEELGYRVENFTRHFKPIHAFYELEGVKGDAEIKIDEIKGFAKFNTLLPNYLYMFSWLKPVRLNYLAQMLNTVRVFRVQVPWDIERLNEVYEMIIKHSKSIK